MSEEEKKKAGNNNDREVQSGTKPLRGCIEGRMAEAGSSPDKTHTHTRRRQNGEQRPRTKRTDPRAPNDATARHPCVLPSGGWSRVQSSFGGHAPRASTTAEPGHCGIAERRLFTEHATMLELSSLFASQVPAQLLSRPRAIPSALKQKIASFGTLGPHRPRWEPLLLAELPRCCTNPFFEHHLASRTDDRRAVWLIDTATDKPRNRGELAAGLGTFHYH